MRLLVTGVSSGLGAYLNHELGGTGFSRVAEKDLDRSVPYDAIIHCAFNSSREVSPQDFHAYVDDNLGLTERLLKVPHRRFVYISSIDVYPDDGRLHGEDEFLMERQEELYSTFKLRAEALVQSAASNWLILRSSALLGPGMRKNSLIRILEEEKPQISLSSDSRLNYVMYEDVRDFIWHAALMDCHGAFNLCSSVGVSLGELAERLGKTGVQFGHYRYIGDRALNDKAIKILPRMNRSSHEVVEQFVKTMQSAVLSPKKQ